MVKPTILGGKTECDCGPVGCMNPADPKCKAAKAVRSPLKPTMVEPTVVVQEKMIEEFETKTRMIEIDTPKAIRPTAIERDPGNAILRSPEPTKPKVSSWTPSVPPPQAAPPVAHKPSSLPGKSRQTLHINRDEVADRFPTYDDETIDATCRVLSGVILELLNVSHALTFGVGVQQRFNETVDRWLKTLEGDQVRTSARHVQRLKEVLQEVANSLGAGQSWFRRESIQSKFDKIKPEIDQLKQLLKTSEIRLNQTQVTLAELKATSKSLFAEMTGTMLACDFLVSKVSTDVGGVLTERGISLGKTLGLLQQQVIKLETDEQNITILLTSIQDGVLVALPALWSTVATAVQDEKNDTQRFIIRDQIFDVIRKLT